MIEIARKQASGFACSWSQPYFLYSSAKIQAMVKTFPTECETILPFSVFTGHSHLQHAGEKGKGGPVCPIMDTSPGLIYLLKIRILLHTKRLVPFDPLQTIQPIMKKMMMAQLRATSLESSPILYISLFLALPRKYKYNNLWEYLHFCASSNERNN